MGPPLVTTAAPLELRVLEGERGGEVYLTARPGGDPAPAFGDIARALRSLGARIFAERWFASADIVDAALAARARAYGELDDGVPPTVLVAAGTRGLVAGIQVHAMRGAAEVVHLQGRPCGRLLRRGGARWLAAGLRAETAGGDALAQARQALGDAETLLAQAGAGLEALARTWFFMRDILAWYPRFNQLRTELYAARGMLADGRMPASTGIGVAPAGDGSVALDVLAAWGEPELVRRHHAAGRQRSAHEYGSSFARAARVRTPGGATVLCSGTAAIDERGATCHAGDARAQVRMSMDNVLAVLAQLGCAPAEVVQATAYCATGAAAAALGDQAAGLPWPLVVVPGDNCRRDLAFELEVTACPGAGRR